jgi:hypothetical protein
MDPSVAGRTQSDQQFRPVTARGPVVNVEPIPCPTAATAIPVSLEYGLSKSTEAGFGMPFPPAAAAACS